MVRRVLASWVVALFVNVTSVEAQIQGVPLRVNPMTDAPIRQEGTPVTTIRIGEPTAPATASDRLPDPASMQQGFNGPDTTPVPAIRLPDVPPMPPTPAPVKSSSPTTQVNYGQSVSQFPSRGPVSTT